jgi:hypothetical protein
VTPGANRWSLAAGLLALVAVLAVVIAAFAISRDDNDEQTTATRQIAAAQQACRQWLDSGDVGVGNAPGRDWCDRMAGWMTDDLANGRMMVGPMMWDSPQAMRETCVQAMGRAGFDNPSRWCDRMVAWMSDHMGGWDRWRDYRGD